MYYLTGMMTRPVLGFHRIVRLPTFDLSMNKAFLQFVVHFVNFEFNDLELKAQGGN